MFARREPSLWLDERGSALIEGAAVIPLLIALVSGVFEFSWLFYQSARVGAQGRSDCRAGQSDQCPGYREHATRHTGTLERSAAASNAANFDLPIGLSHTPRDGSVYHPSIA